MISFTGVHITREFGSPTIRDMAVQGCRITRFGGAGEVIPHWPIALHSILVANLLPTPLRAYGLLHDVGHEVAMSDIPKPLKTAEQKALANVLQRRTYEALGIPAPTKKQEVAIHEADMAACNAEGAAGCGPRGYEETQDEFSLDPVAAEELRKLLFHEKFAHYNLHTDETEWRFNELLLSDGYWPLEFERDLRSALRDMHQRQVGHIDNRKAA